MIHNPYWDIAQQRAKPAMRWPGEPGPAGLEIGGLGDLKAVRGGPTEEYFEAFRFREFATHRYAWTVTDPVSVDFVAKNSGGCLIDPMAGTGYWCYLLIQCGVNCIASDCDPPRAGITKNIYHPDTECFVTVAKMDAALAVEHSDPRRTLLLSWPPYATTDGVRVLRAYQGERVIYIGEGNGGCNADEDFFELLEKEWDLRSMHRPVQFYGIHDYIRVYDRRNQSAVES